MRPSHTTYRHVIRRPNVVYCRLREAIPYLGSVGGHRPILKVNGKKHTYVYNISPHRRTNCEPRKCHIYAYIQHISALEDQMWTKGVTHIQFISAPEDQMWIKGRVTYIQFISAPDDQMWIKGRVTYIEFISAPDDQMWTKGVTHIQFNFALQDQLWTKGKSHIFSMHLRTRGPTMKSHTCNQCIFTPEDPMWTKIKPHTYIFKCFHTS